MITPEMKIGFIRMSKDSRTGKETFKFIEAKIERINIGKTKTSISTDKFYALDAKEIESNTNIISEGKLILVDEPFITNDEYSEQCRKNVDYWNEYGAKSIFD